VPPHRLRSAAFGRSLKVEARARRGRWRRIARRFWAVADGYWQAPESRRPALLLLAGLLAMIGTEVALPLRFTAPRW